MAVNAVTVLGASAPPVAATPAAAPADKADARPVNADAGNPGQPSGNPPADAAKPPGEVDINEDDLKRWSRLANENRTLRERVAAAEKDRPDVEGLRARASKLDAFDGHVKAGKHLEAAKAIGLDLEAAFAEWMQTEQQQQTPPEVRELQAKLAALEAEREERSKQSKAAEEQEAAAQQRRHQEAARAEFAKRIEEDAKSTAPKYPHCAAAPDAAQDVLVIAQKAASAARTKLGRNLNDAEVEQLMATSLVTLEAHYKALAERLGKVTPPPAAGGGNGASSSTRDADPVARPTSMTIDSRRGSLTQPQSVTPKYETAEAAKKRILEAARARNRRAN